MSKIFVAVQLVVVAIIFSACVPWPAEEPETTSEEVSASVTVNNGLLVKKVTIVTSNGTHELDMEVASTEAQRRTGLMHRRSLDEGKGMLFLFDNQGYLNFWMKNTLIALDMIFVDEAGMIRHIVHQAQPCTAMRDADCPKYSSQYPAKYVLEIGGGMAQQWGVTSGDRVSW